MQQEKKDPPRAKKDLLRMEKAIYGLMDEETDPKEAAVKKLMEAKKKPNFEPPKKSSLLLQVKSFIPIIKKENARLLNQPIETIDNDFEKQSSSQSSDNEVELQKQQTMEEEVVKTHVNSKNKQIEMNLLLINPHQRQQEQEEEGEGAQEQQH